MNWATEEEKKEECRQKRLAKKQRIQELYQIVSADFPERSREWLEMVEELEAYSAPAVWAVLNKSPFATASAFETIKEMARDDLYGQKVFEGYQRAQERDPDCMFSDYCRGIYRNKALTYMEEMIRRSKMEKEFNPGVMASGGDGGFSDRMELDDQERFLKCYVDAVMTSNANPFHIIFLCYSKILPVVLQLTNCSSADKWAWKHMQHKDMQQLSDDFVLVFNSTMRAIRVKWSRQYGMALKEAYTSRQGKTITVGEAVLTDEFTRSSTKNWVARLHARVVKKLVAGILEGNDEELIQLAMKHTQNKCRV